MLRTTEISELLKIKHFIVKNVMMSGWSHFRNESVYSKIYIPDNHAILILPRPQDDWKIAVIDQYLNSCYWRMGQKFHRKNP